MPERLLDSLKVFWIILVDITKLAASSNKFHFLMILISELLYLFRGTKTLYQKQRNRPWLNN